jgi:hypothetical protein
LPVIWYAPGAVRRALQHQRRLLGRHVEPLIEQRWDVLFAHHKHRWMIPCPYCRCLTLFLVLGQEDWGCRSCHGRRRHGPACEGGQSPEGCRRRVDTIRRLDFRAGVLLFMLRIGVRGRHADRWHRKVAEEAASLLGKTDTRYDVMRLSRAAQVLQYDHRQQWTTGRPGRLMDGIANEWLDSWLFHWSPPQVARRAWVEAQAVGGVYLPEPPRAGSAGPGSWGPDV